MFFLGLYYHTRLCSNIQILDFMCTFYNSAIIFNNVSEETNYLLKKFENV